MLVVHQCISKTLLIEISVDETLQIQRIFKKWMGLILWFVKLPCFNSVRFGWTFRILQTLD